MVGLYALGFAYLLFLFVVLLPLLMSFHKLDTPEHDTTILEVNSGLIIFSRFNTLLYVFNNFKVLS